MLSFLLLPLSGCLSEDASTDGDATNAPDGGSEEEFDAATAYLFEACDDACLAEAGQAPYPLPVFDDEAYHQVVLYAPPSPVFDIVVVPSIGPESEQDVQVALQAIADWERAVQEFGSPWFQNSIELNIQVVDADVDPASVQHADVFVLLTHGVEDNAPNPQDPSNSGARTGVGIEFVDLVCDNPERLVDEHAHEEATSRISQCEDDEYQCFAINTASAASGDLLHDLVLHEFGHCLGAGHVGDAGDFKTRYAPWQDSMSYTNDPERDRCTSNMDIAMLEAIFADLGPDDQVQPLEPKEFLEFDPAMYRQGTCSPVES